MNAYETRRQNRINRALDRAANASKAADSLWKKGKSMASVIPFGQPILVGHHSERRDRNYRAKIQGTFRKASEATGKAKYYTDKAASIQNSTAISSDDPEAIVKLREKIQKAETMQENFKAINKHLKAKKGPNREELHKFNLTDCQIDSLLSPDFAGRVGIPSYELTNNRANIRRMKERLALLEKNSQDEEKETIVNGVRIVENVEVNRCQMFFDGKPADSIRASLKSHGFRWSPSNGCWQRQRSNAATYYAHHVANQI